MGGHAVDGSTVHLWKLKDENTLANLLTTAETGPSALTFTAASRIVAPRIVKGPRTNTYGRIFNSTNNHLMTANDVAGAAAASLQGDITVRFWFLLPTASVNYALLGYGASGETEATNLQINVRIQSSNRLGIGWESGAGTDTNINQSVGTGVSANTWYGAAIVRTGGNVLFYLYNEDGSPYGGTALQQTVAHATVPTGGSSGKWALGGDVYNGVTARFNGILGSVEILNTALSGATLATDMAASTKFTSSANTVLLLNFTETPEVYDETGNMHLTATATYGQGAPAMYGTDKTAFFPGDNTTYLEIPHVNYLAHQNLVTLFKANEHTIELCFELALDDPAIVRGLFVLGTPGTDSSSTNNLYGFQIDTSKHLAGLSEYNTGQDATYLSDAPVLTSGNRYSPHYLAVVKNAGAHKIYFDSVEISSFTFTSNLTGAAAGTFKFPFGFSGNGFIGSIGDFRISNIARTPTEITNYYNALTAQTGAPKGLNFRRYGLGGEV